MLLGIQKNRIKAISFILVACCLFTIVIALAKMATVFTSVSKDHIDEVLEKQNHRSWQ